MQLKRKADTPLAGKTSLKSAQELSPKATQAAVQSDLGQISPSTHLLTS